MDAERFDTLARSLKTPHTRRGLTRYLGGIALGPLALLGLAETGAKRKKKKKKKRPTSSVIYVPVPAGDCPDGFRTCNGVCRDLLSDSNNCGRCGRSCGTHSTEGQVNDPRPCCQGRCLLAGDCCLDSDCPPGDICTTSGECVTGAGTCDATLNSCPDAKAFQCHKDGDPICTCVISTENEVRCGRPLTSPFCNDSLDCGMGGFCPRADCNPNQDPNQPSICYEVCYFDTRFA